MKIYIIGENPVLPYLINALSTEYDIKTDINKYTKDLDVKKLSKSDMSLSTNFADLILILDLNIIDNKIELSDGLKTFNKNIIELYKDSYWITLHTNDKWDFIIDKYDLNYAILSEVSPFYITSKLATTQTILQQLIVDNNKLLHQQKTLVLGYSDMSKLLCDQLSANKMIVVVSDRLLKELVEAKKEGYGILLKEEINTKKIKFDNIIIDDYYFKDLIKTNDNQNVYIIDYKEQIIDTTYKLILPCSLSCNLYTSLIAQNIISSLKKLIRDYYKEA